MINFCLPNFPLFWLWRYIHRYHVIIFMIHGVTDNIGTNLWRPLRKQLPQNYLDQGIATLSRYFHFISLDQAVAMLAGEASFQPYSMALTFDDGYRNNLTHALPVLKRHKVPATFYLATGHIEHREPFWYDRIDYALQHLKKRQIVHFDNRDFLFQPGQVESLGSSFMALRTAVKASLHDYNKVMKDINIISCIIEDNAGCRLADVFEDDHYTAIMDWEDVKRASAEGVTFGSHTIDHVLLDRLDESASREQVVMSRKMIESHTGKPCRHFSYPYGAWNERVLKIVREYGFLSATTTKYGYNKIGNCRFSLRRISFSQARNHMGKRT